MSKKHVSMAIRIRFTPSCRVLCIVAALLLLIGANAGCGRRTVPPQASFSASPTSGQAPLTVSFSDTSTGATGWSWDFDNDGTADSASQNPTHVYDTAGTFSVKLAVTGAGGSASETKSNYISVTAPSTPGALTAGFTCSKTSGQAPLEVQFTDTSTGAVSWSWDFNYGGGTAEVDSTSQNPQHTYDLPGSYYVRLEVAGAGGDSAHMLQLITVSEATVPYVYDENWWNDERLVWYYGQPLGSGQQQYYDAMTQTGVGAVSWLDLRFTQNWETTIGQIVTNCHNKGIPAVGTLSMMNTYQEQGEAPPNTEITDPWGNQILFPDYDFVIYSMIHPDWVDYLKDCIERTIDLGVDGLLLDELCYGNVYNPDFSDDTMEQFRQWLEDTYTTGELTSKGISDISIYDYAQAVRDHLAGTSPGMTQITIADWTWELWSDLPLSGDYQRFLREANRETAEVLVQHAKDYASNTYGKTIPVTANLSDMTAAEALYIVDLLDFVTLEWHYMDHTYFPVGRAFASVKLAEAFDKPVTILTDMATRSDIVDNRQDEDLATVLYKTMIADACAAGGAFHLEEGGHGVEQDLTALAPYYNFVPDNPDLFNGLSLAGDSIGVLHLWEAIHPYHADAYRGMCNLLADTGYQFNTIFAAEDYTWWGEPTETPAPPEQTLALGDLSPYEVIIVPELIDITPNHADVLLQYVNGGGMVIVFAEPDDINTLDDHRNEPIDTHINTLLDKLAPGENIYGAGKIIRYNDIWGTQYLDTTSQTLRTNIKTKLSSEDLDPAVDIPVTATAVSAFVYEATGRRVIHLVNYNYNPGNDTTASVAGLDLDIDLGDLSDTGLTVTLYTPEAPDGTVLPHTASSGTVDVTVPTLDVWGVLVLENS